MYRALLRLPSSSAAAATTGAPLSLHRVSGVVSLCSSSSLRCFVPCVASMAPSAGHRGPLVQPRRFHGHGGERDKPVQVEFILPDGESKVVTGYEGQSLLDVCAEQGLPMEGACGGSCACSTCHVYLEEKDTDRFQEPTDEENDMIDQAFYPEPTSRLGCQLKLKRGVHDGLKVRMPRATRNMYVDGAKVVPH